MKTTLLMLAALLLAAPALALDYDQNVTPDVIFGSGNANGAFTVDTQTAGSTTVELGLRGKLRFDAANQPQNIFNRTGDGAYYFQAGAAPVGFSWEPGSPTTPVWNFEFAVNVDQTGVDGGLLDQFTYELGLDFDPSPGGTSYLIFDPITAGAAQPYWDHSLGNNTTTAATDWVAGDEASYISYLADLSVAQNSWSYEFFNNAPYDTFDPDDNGVYEIYLKAFLNGVEVAHTAISIVVGNAVPNEDTSWGGIKTLFQ